MPNTKYGKQNHTIKIKLKIKYLKWDKQTSKWKIMFKSRTEDHLKQSGLIQKSKDDSIMRLEANPEAMHITACAAGSHPSISGSTPAFEASQGILGPRALQIIPKTMVDIV